MPPQADLRFLENDETEKHTCVCRPDGPGGGPRGIRRHAIYPHGAGGEATAYGNLRLYGRRGSASGRRTGGHRE